MYMDPDTHENYFGHICLLSSVALGDKVKQTNVFQMFLVTNMAKPKWPNLIAKATYPCSFEERLRCVEQIEKT